LLLLAPRHLMFSSHVVFADFATLDYLATILYPPHLTYHTYLYYINASLFIATTSLAVSSMAGKRARVDALAIATTAPATKRTRVAQRHRGTASQPVPVDTQPSSLSPPPPPFPQSPRQALVASSQAPNCEATIQASRAEDTILPPNKGSEQVTIAASTAGSEAIDAGFVWVEDNYEGFDWSRYPNFCKPPTTLSSRAS
jgi:hypothetical protein